MCWHGIVESWVPGIVINVDVPCQKLEVHKKCLWHMFITSAISQPETSHWIKYADVFLHGTHILKVGQAVFDLSKVLNGNVREGHTEEQSACPPMLREHSQGPAIGDDHQHLGDENGLNGTGKVETKTNDFWIPNVCSHFKHKHTTQPLKKNILTTLSTGRQNVPHIHHLLRCDFREQEGQVLRHWIWLVGSWKQTVGLQAPVLRHWAQKHERRFYHVEKLQSKCGKNVFFWWMMMTMMIIDIERCELIVSLGTVLRICFACQNFICLLIFLTCLVIRNLQLWPTLPDVLFSLFFSTFNILSSQQKCSKKTPWKLTPKRPTRNEK